MVEHQNEFVVAAHEIAIIVKCIMIVVVVVKDGRIPRGIEIKTGIILR